MKKFLTVGIVILFIITILSGNVQAAANVGVSSKAVNKGDIVTVTISFNPKVMEAQFYLNYDTSKLEYIEDSATTDSSALAEFGTAKKKFEFTGKKANISKASLKFKAKETGKANVSIASLLVSTATETRVSMPVGSAKTTITINEPKKETNNDNKNDSNKDNNSNKNNNNKNNNSSTTNNKTSNKNTSNENNNSNVKVETEKKLETAPDELIDMNREDIRTLTDEDSKVMIKILQTSFDSDFILKTTVMENESEEYKQIENILNGIQGNKKIFNIELFKNNEKVQPNGYVTVCIPIPEEWNKDKIQVYYINEETKNYELVSGKVQGDYYTFTTNHFSKYAMVETQNPDILANADVESVPVMQRIADFFTNVNALYCIIGFLIILIIILTIKINKNSKH